MSNDTIVGQMSTMQFLADVNDAVSGRCHTTQCRADVSLKQQSSPHSYSTSLIALIICQLVNSPPKE